MGHMPTLMDYSRFNYVAQPEDGIALDDLVPKIGPYDIWATHWGYAPIPGAKTPDDERTTLDQWAREQDTKPWLRFATSDAGSAPIRGNNTEAVGDDDAVPGHRPRPEEHQAPDPDARPGHHGHRRPRTTADLKEMYGRLLGQWSTEMRHVAVIPGTLESQEKYISQPGPRYTPVSAARQREAVKFLNENAFATPTYFIVPEILEKMQPDGEIPRIVAAQSAVLSTLFSDARLARMIEIETVYKPKDVYTLPAYLADIRGGIWGELGNGSVRIDPYRRGLQQAWLDQIKGKIIAGPPPAGLPAGFVIPRTPHDVQAIMRLELKTLDAAIAAALPKAGDAMTKAHLTDVRFQIDQTLNPKN